MQISEATEKRLREAAHAWLDSEIDFFRECMIECDPREPEDEEAAFQMLVAELNDSMRCGYWASIFTGTEKK